MDLEPLGESAFVATFDCAQAARGWAEGVRTAGLAGVVDVVLAYRSVAVFVDPQGDVGGAIEAALRGVEADLDEESAGRLVLIPTLYDGADLQEVAARSGLDGDRVIAVHSGPIYDVFAIGFLPGFPYCGDLPDALAGLPRRADPRMRVPAGSVAIAGRQTGIYPQDSPGGWHLIGRTPLSIVDLDARHFPIRAGDRVRFVPIGREEFEGRRGERLDRVE